MKTTAYGLLIDEARQSNPKTDDSSTGSEELFAMFKDGPVDIPRSAHSLVATKELRPITSPMSFDFYPSNFNNEDLPPESLNRWEGYVSKISDEMFTVVLTPLDSETEPFEADFQKALLEDFELLKLVEGAYVYVHSVIRRVGGRKASVATVKFRDLPARTQMDIDDSLNYARRIREMFVEDDESS